MCGQDLCHGDLRICFINLTPSQTLRIYDEGLNEEGCKMLSMSEILVQSSRSDTCCIYVAPVHAYMY